VKHIYCVASGCYSDYRVHAVFEREDDAARYAVELSKDRGDDEGWALRSSDARVEIMPYYPEGGAPEIVTVYRAALLLYDDGRVMEDFWPFRETMDVKPQASQEWSHEVVVGARPVLRYVRAPIYSGKGGRIEGTCLDARALIQAIKDRAAMFKAGAWNPRSSRELNWQSGEEPAS